MKDWLIVPENLEYWLVQDFRDQMGFDVADYKMTLKDMLCEAIKSGKRMSIVVYDAPSALSGEIFKENWIKNGSPRAILDGDKND
jgi:hypothetical protein